LEYECCEISAWEMKSVLARGGVAPGAALCVPEEHP
jgi:hypothetical protein